MAFDDIRGVRLYSYWELGMFSVSGPPAFAEKMCQAPWHLCKKFLLTIELPGEGSEKELHET